MSQRIEKKSVRLSTVEAESHFVQVGREMLGADPMPRSDDAAFKQRECGFHCVGCHHEALLVPDVLFGFVVDGLSLGSLRYGKALVVKNGFIGHDNVHVFADVFLQNFADRLRVGISDVDKLQFAVALNDADYGFFVIPIVADANTLAPTADVGFVNFDCAVEHLLNFGHSETDSVAEIPCGLVGAFVVSPERALHLQSAHALLRFAEQKCGEEPLLQGEMGIIEHGPGRNAELVIAAFAVEQLFRRREFDGWHLAPWALDAIGPAKTHKQFAALLIGVEQVYNVN